MFVFQCLDELSRSGAAVDMFGRQAECLLRCLIGAAVDMFGRQAECLLQSVIVLVSSFIRPLMCLLPYDLTGTFVERFRDRSLSVCCVYCLLTPLILRRRTRCSCFCETVGV